jgi:hypothetical protein
MKLFLLVLVVLGAIFPSGKAHTASMPTPMSASYLHYACKESEQNEYAKGFCEGAIDALYSLIEMWCVPPDITHGEISQHIKKDLLATSEELNMSAYDFVKGSIGKAWPCR